MNKDDKRNAEGYLDPTAYQAIKNVEKRIRQMKIYVFISCLTLYLLFVSCLDFILKVELQSEISEQGKFGGDFDEKTWKTD